MGVFLGYSAPSTLSQALSLSQELMDSVSLAIQLAPGCPNSASNELGLQYANFFVDSVIPIAVLIPKKQEVFHKAVPPVPNVYILNHYTIVP